jgi:hypothetical protein
MTTEPAKTATPAQEHPFPPPTVAYPPQHFNGAYPPPGPPGAYPPYFAYPPPPDGANGENGQNGAPPGPPYMMFPPPPPGMVYAYNPPPAQGLLSTCSAVLTHHLTIFLGFSPPPSNGVPTALSRPKRKQVKMAVWIVFLCILFLIDKIATVYELCRGLQALRREPSLRAMHEVWGSRIMQKWFAEGKEERG